MFYKFMKIVLAPNTVAHIKNNFYNADIGQENSETQISVEGLPVLNIPAGLGGFIDVVIAHIESVDKFFCQLQNQAELIVKFSNELNAFYNDSSAKPYINPTNGTMCVAKYSLDNCWYRGFVLERPTPALVEIYFVDYGNTERVQKTDLRVITKEFEQYPPQAFQCKLKGLSASPAMLAKFKSCAEGSSLTVKMEGKLDKAFEVLLFDTNPSTKQECNINDYLNGRTDVEPSKVLADRQQAQAPQRQSMTNGFSGGGGSDDGFQRKNDFGGNRGGRSDRGGGQFGGGGRYDGEGGGFRGGRGGRGGGRGGRGGFGGNDGGFGGGNESGGEGSGFGGGGSSGFGGGGFGGGSNGFSDGGSDDRRGGYRGGRGGDRGGRGGGRGRFGDREGGGYRGGRGGGGGRRDGGFGDGGGRGFGSNESGGGGFSSGFSNDAGGGGGFQSNGGFPSSSSGFDSAPAPNDDNFGSSSFSAAVVEKKVDPVENTFASAAAPSTGDVSVPEMKESERLSTQPEESSKPVESSLPETHLATTTVATTTAPIKYVRFQPLRIPAENVADVYLSVAVSPDEVYAQLVSEADQLLVSTDNLQKYCNDPSTSRKLPRDSIFLGMACAAKYTDDSFYRCVPTSINLDYDTAQVYFVDFGNSQSVPLTELYELSDEFIAQTCYAVRCRLDGLAPPEGSTSYGEEAQQDIDLLAVNDEGVPKKFECRFSSRFEPCLVELQCEGERLDEQLTRLNHCQKVNRGRYFDGPYKKLDPAKLTRVVAVVSYAETPSSMYIYPSHHQPEQDGLIVQLPAEYGDPSVEIDSLSKTDAVVGAVCAAKYSVDETWYRSEIVEVGDDEDTTCTVRFVDYGNTENCKLSDLKKLFYCYGALPALALNVKMDGVIAQETSAALEKFVEIVHQMDTDYAIEFVDSTSTSSPYSVKLFVPGETVSINDQLNAAISALCESVVFDEKKKAEILATTEDGGVIVSSSPEPEPAALAACITEKLLSYVDAQGIVENGDVDSQDQKSESIEQRGESESENRENNDENDKSSPITEQEISIKDSSNPPIDDSPKVEDEN